MFFTRTGFYNTETSDLLFKITKYMYYFEINQSKFATKLEEKVLSRKTKM